MSALLPALLLGVATTALLSGRCVAPRLRELAPKPPQVRAEGPSPALIRGVTLLAGGVVFLVLGGITGAVLGAAIAWAGPSLLGRLDATEGDATELAAQLPLALDLLGACLAGGSTLHDAVAAVAEAMPGAVGSRLQRVHASLAVGASTAEAFAVLGTERGPAGSAARALARSAEGGAPVAVAVGRVAADARRVAASEATARARKAGVTSTAPLGACFLPAFLLIGVVPTVIGLAAPVLAGVR